MKINLPLIATAFCLSYGLNAQNGKMALTNNATQIQNVTTKKACGTEQPPAEWDSWMNKKAEEFKASKLTGKGQTTAYTIPVIVHVIHGGQPVGTFPNITQAQINSQITVLNNDFAGTGVNVNQLAATAFSAVGAANCGVSFCLALKDTNGNMLAEPGIDRIDYNANAWANPVSFTSITNFRNYIEGVVKLNTIWNPTRYLNIWLTDCNQNNVGLLGYATFPAGSTLSGLTTVGDANTDGIWVWPASHQTQ